MAAASFEDDDKGGRWPAVLGFVLMTAPMLGLTGALWVQPMPAPLYTPKPGRVEAQGTEEVPLQYIDLPDPLSVATAPGEPRMQVTLAVAIRAELEKLLPMKDVVTAKSQRISALMLGVAQDMVAAGADSDTLHRDLPAALRGVINRELGTEDWPEPVEEVLITSLMVQE